MFKSPTSRFVLRCALVGAASLITYLSSTIPVGWIDLEYGLLYGVGASLAYSGVGALVPQVEPKVGRKLKA